RVRTRLVATTGSHPAVRLKQDRRTLRNSGQLNRTRSAVTIPLLRVQLLMPAVADAAQTAARATYALRGGWESGETGLAARREHAIAMTDELVAAAGRHLSAS
ncbi:protein kilB, partial [Streptomyces sp. NPDC048324]